MALAQLSIRPGGGRQSRPAAATADGRPLVHQRGEGHRPPAVDLAQPVGVGDPHVGEEDLVERRAPGHLAQGPDLDARCVHVDHEAGQALVLGQRPGRSGR